MQLRGRLQKQRDRGARIRDYIAYVAIGLLVMVALVVMKWVGVGNEGFVKWGGLAFFSSLLFGSFIADNRVHLYRWTFWGWTSALLVAHLAIFAILFVFIKHWRLIWFVGMYLEYPVFSYATGRLGRASRQAQVSASGIEKRSD